MNDKSLTAWQFFWLGVLYNIPLLGFIFLVVHCFCGSTCRKSFARSHFCGVFLILIVVGIICIILAAKGTLGTAWANLISAFKNNGTTTTGIFR